ncbi:MAG: Phospho-N-acetylmuramoyl-pentapeptide-transferase [Fimbriimonadaceae bacterium]|nr:Phospho-N-acetylmuramoyl-pentapeptide-transferase [Fimbriimonadaceae bacterium]
MTAPGVVLIFAAAAGLFVSWPVMWMLRAMKSRQTISQYAPEGHQKKQGTPTMGGLIVLLAVGAAFSQWPQGLSVPLLLLIGFAVIGFVDDYLWPKLKPGSRGLSWKPKLVLQLVAAWVPLVLWGNIGDWKLAALAILIVAFANAFNFADGLDGLAGGLLAIIGGAFALIGMLSGNDPLVIEGAACAGGAVAFLFWNSPPARVFMGDVGSLPLGALIGWMAIESMTPGARDSANLVTPLVLSGVLLAELVPVPMQILAVKTLKRRIFPATPIHHSFEVKGWPESRIVWTFLLVQVLLAAVAVTTAGLGSVKA